MSTKRKKQSAAEWEETCHFLLQETREALLSDIEDAVADQANRLQEIGNATSREIRKAVLAGLERALKPVLVPQTLADKRAGIWRDSQGRGWSVPKSVKVK